MGKIASFKFQRVRVSRRSVHKGYNIVDWLPAISVKSFLARAMIFAFLSLAAMFFRTELASSNTVYSAAISLMQPVIITYNYINNSASEVFSFFQSKRILQHQIAQLKQQNVNLLSWREVALRNQKELDAMRKLMQVSMPLKHQTVTVNVLSQVSSGFHQSLLVNSAPGVKNNQPVINEYGLLGRVMSVSRGTSQVMLITDSNSRVPVTVEGTSVQGIARGNNSLFLDIHLKVHDEDVKVGQRLLASGFGGIFPKDVPVAVVVSARNGLIKARPIANNGQMELVKIVTGYSQGTPFYQR